MTAYACAACLRRTWLVATLAPNIDLVTGRKVRAWDLLSLDDDALIEAVAGRGAADLRARLEHFDPLAATAGAAACGGEVVCRHAGTFPSALAQIPGAPAALHVLGDRRLLDRDIHMRAVAIVGARRASAYGQEVARTLGRDLAVAGVPVISGMAFGADAAAHEGALDGAGVTIAVLAGGPDIAYPASKRALHTRIAAAGCVVSEFPPGFRAFKWCFPARNRIIAALARLTVVVEATDRSGSLITAKAAREIGHDVGAVPGRVTTEAASGTNQLLRDGAAVIRDARDALDELHGVGGAAAAASNASDNEHGDERPDVLAGLEEQLRRVLDAVADGQSTLNGLMRATGADLPQIAGSVTRLEALGLLERTPRGEYSRSGAALP